MTDGEQIGLWNLQDLGLILAAHSDPRLDPLMAAYHEAQAAVSRDEARVRQLIKPWASDRQHNALRREYQAARVKVIVFLLAHPHLFVVNGR